MTTIATDGISMSSDGRSTGGGEILSERTVKISHLPDGSVIGGAGGAPESALAIAAIKEGILSGDPTVRHAGKFSLLRLMPGGTVLYYYENNQHPIEIASPAAIGSGGEYARGAMMAGASSAEAVHLAKKLDAYSGGRIRTLSPRR